MLDKLIHVNSAGETLKIGDGIFLNYSNLRDFGEQQKTLPFIICDKPETRDKFFEHFEKDVLSENDGYFEINEYRCYGVITKIKNTNYLIDDIYIKKDVVFNTKTNWIKQISKTFNFDEDDVLNETNQKKYTYKYPFVYNSVKGIGSLVNNAHFKTDCIVNFYGPCVNPFVKISNHIYQINITLLNNEYVSINTKERTVSKVDVVGNKTNAFVYRSLTSSPFEKIASGTSIVAWDPIYSVEIIIVEERGEPKWK